MRVSIIGMDIAKNVFHLVGLDGRGREVMRKTLRRKQVLRTLANIEPCVVGMEACSGAHWWAREIGALGHEARLVSARTVKGYVPGAKNDYNDALGICEALSRAAVRLVPVKEQWQQDIQALHRLRQAAVGERTALANRVRALLAENGVVVQVGLARLRRELPWVLEDAENALSALMRELLAEQYQELVRLDERISSLDRRIQRVVREYDGAKRLAQVFGIGALNASASLATLGDALQFANGRGFSASLGLVPHQHGTGGKIRLLGISKRGDPYLRYLFINGARSVLRLAKNRTDRLSRWAEQVRQRRGFNIAVVALANKLARIAWAIIARGEAFDPNRA